ncbi:MBL fold metallo-hydrolase [Kiloniella laminariae]|uniref:MBL fold metallo-hydrolase n=1 Tax=Kiloniella laminariae TaxID=454162 RepID=A0ABT4LJY9_9PROT|nr:MBL fold metallo-hydrolase [Kiloniella laminariae]MCZ4281399.1 MBL fold metallo-hydrolase [Kiloniella laminariae]
MTLTRRSLLQGSLKAAGATVGIAAGAGLLSSVGGSGALIGSSLAAAAPSGSQSPGVYRFTVGAFEVTALLDGYIDADPALIPEFDRSVASELYRSQFRAPLGEKVRIGVNCFVINTGDKLVLVDSGTADKYGPTVGKLPENLRVAGIAPESIDAILITHMHIDHISGISSADGKALFPNAELIVHKADWDFWHDDAVIAKAAEFMQTNALNSRAMALPYQKRLTLIEEDGEILPGIEAMALPGHTPGHMGCLLRSDGQELLIWGDVVHFSALQFAYPEWSVVFDVDMAQAKQTRRRMLDRVAADRVAVLGSHLDFPGLGHVARDGDSFRYVPSSWQYQI